MHGVSACAPPSAGIGGHVRLWPASAEMVFRPQAGQNWFRAFQSTIKGGNRH